MPEMQQHFAFNLRVLTYNVFLRPPPIKTNADDYKEERFRDILSVIDRFDIVCFQELFQTATFRSEDIIEFAISRGSSQVRQDLCTGRLERLPTSASGRSSIQGC